MDWLKGHDQVVLKGESIDLTLSIKDRVFIPCDGKINFPDGEIFTGPVEDSVNGWVRFKYPAIEYGQEVTDIELWFENGKVVKEKASKNQELLTAMLETDAGARYLGELGHRHQLRHPALHQEHALRREDRRHDPPGGRRGLPGERQQERLGHPLGYAVRHARMPRCRWMGSCSIRMASRRFELLMNANDVLIDLLEDNRRRLKRLVAGMSDDCLQWRPQAEANSIAITVWHMARIFDVFLTQQAKGEPPAEECWFRGGWAAQTGYDPPRQGSEWLGDAHRVHTRGSGCHPAD